MALLVVVSCAGSDEITKSITQWLRVSGGGDDPAEVVECLSDFMHEELTPG